MSTLYRRATPRQALVLRIVEGAALNAAHAHPDRPLDRTMARSIAKRAAGTLTAQWPEVLARPSVGASDQAASHGRDSRPRSGDIRLRPRGTGRAPQFAKARAQLRYLHNAVGEMAGKARRAGEAERYAALVDVLREIARLQKGPAT